MSQLVCPLCGRFVSLRYFDPSSFESDIFAVNVRGLGRGKGVAISEMFSILDEPAITGHISKRCRVILGLIEGMKVLSDMERGFLLKLKVKRWRDEAIRERRVKEDLIAKLADQEAQIRYWRNKASRLQKKQEEHSPRDIHLRPQRDVQFSSDFQHQPLFFCDHHCHQISSSSLRLARACLSGRDKNLL